MSHPVRLDAHLVSCGLAPSRARAAELIASGQVLVDGIVADKPARQVRPEQSVALAQADHGWVGRGALKLLGAIESFSLDPTGVVAADFGASTGGFTEVLLAKGALKVYAIDVGRGQLAWKLRTDPRVVVMEGTNARALTALPDPIDWIVGDLSFISLDLILPSVRALLRPGGTAVLLVKPQFEAGREAIARGGIVRDADARAGAIARVADTARSLGFVVRGQADCVLPGAKAGNVEHFLFLTLPDTE